MWHISNKNLRIIQKMFIVRISVVILRFNEIMIKKTESANLY